MAGFMNKALNLFGLNKKEGEGGAVGGANLEEFLNEFPSKIGYDVSFKRKESTEPGVHFEIEGPEADSFLGENCEMLDALAHISMRVLRRTEGVSNAPLEEGQEGIFRVTFDCAGFRDKKAQELKDLAATQRQRVIETGGKPSYIRALGPADRKIIHTHLADLGEVTSESIGRGNFKRIRVKLKDDSQYRRAQPEGAMDEGMTPDERGAAPSEGRSFNNRGPRQGGGGRGGYGRGGGRGRGGPRHGGGGGGRGPRQNNNRGNSGPEINGNVAPDLNMYQTNVDDNIGNRLRPGEESPYYPGDKQ